MGKVKFSETKLGKFIKHPVIAIIIASLILGGFALIKWDFIVILLTRKIVAWHLLIVIAVSITLLYLIERYGIRKRKHKQPVPPQFTEYTKNKFGDILYRWEWYKNSGSGKWSIKDLYPYCEDCNCRILYRVGTINTHRCPNCKNDYRPTHNNEEILALIESRLESKYS